MIEYFANNKSFWVVPTLKIVNGVFSKEQGHLVHVTNLVSADYQSNGYIPNIFGTTICYVLLSDTEAKDNNKSYRRRDENDIYYYMDNSDSSYIVDAVFSHYTQGTFVTTIQADANAYTNNASNADGYWYVRGEIVNTAPRYTQIPAQTVRKNTTVTIMLLNYFSDAEGNALSFTASSNNTNIATVSISGSILTLTGKSIGTASITVTANDGSLSTSQTFNVAVANTTPTVSVMQPSENVTLYENDLLQLAGSASDIDTNQSITIYTQINNEQRILLGVGLSNAPVVFNKQLKFKGGRLYDGDTVITGNLTDGAPHIIKIWAQDGDGAESNIAERTFYVVPNRAPALTVDAVVPSGVIDTDKFVIRGTANDVDANSSLIVKYRINDGNAIEIKSWGSITYVVKQGDTLSLIAKAHNVTIDNLRKWNALTSDLLNIGDQLIIKTLTPFNGAWEFDVSLAQLQIGENTIVIEVSDNYNAKTSKTIKLNKNEVKTPVLQSVARYQITPPKGSAKGVLLWIQRDEQLDLSIELSMTLQGEQEQYVTLTADHTAPVTAGIVEDEFYHEVNEPKNSIVLKIFTSRPSIEVNNKIYLISGVLE